MNAPTLKPSTTLLEAHQAAQISAAAKALTGDREALIKHENHQHKELLLSYLQTTHAQHSMTGEARNVMTRRLQGDTYTDIALAYGVSREAIRQRWVRALAQLAGLE